MKNNIAKLNKNGPGIYQKVIFVKPIKYQYLYKTGLRIFKDIFYVRVFFNKSKAKLNFYNFLSQNITKPNYCFKTVIIERTSN